MVCVRTGVGQRGRANDLSPGPVKADVYVVVASRHKVELATRFPGHGFTAVSRMGHTQAGETGSLLLSLADVHAQGSDPEVILKMGFQGESFYMFSVIRQIRQFAGICRICRDLPNLGVSCLRGIVRARLPLLI